METNQPAPKPGALVGIGVVQLVSGALNVVLMWWFMGTVAGTVGGMCTALATLGVFPIGVLCGFVALVLLPIGIAEIASGIVVLAAPASSRTFATVMAVIEIVSLLFGGLISAVAGIVALILLRDEEVKQYLAAAEQQRMSAVQQPYQPGSQVQTDHPDQGPPHQ